jgi:glucose 1-dehydrogenase
VADHSQGATWLGLDGAVVAVTGAVGGIGRAIVESFVDVGAAVALLDRDENQCEEVAKPFRDAEARVAAVGCDIADEASVANAADRVRGALGPVDVLVNNAGILHSGAVTEIEVAEWTRLMGVNLTGFLLCARSFSAHMKEKGAGAIVHTSSIGGHTPQAYAGAYSVSKAGVRMLSQVLAVELGEFGIRSNVVSPAMLITPLSEAFYEDSAMKAQREGMVPSRRIGAPQDIANAIVWLASPRASYVNGEELIIDGGLHVNLLTLIPRPGFDRAAAS